MKNICIDARMALHTGIGTYIRNIIPFIKKSFPTVRVLAHKELVEKCPELKRFDVILTQAPLYSIQEQLELPFKIPSCDIYWTPHYNVPIFPVRARKRIVTIHDIFHWVYGHTLSLPQRIYARGMIKRAATVSDHIITVSEFSSEEIVRCVNVPRDKISVIHNGVDQSLFSQVSENTSPEKYFLFVSTLAPHKNLTRLLRAWNSVIQSHPEWRLLLVGKKVKNVDYLKVFDEFPRLRDHVQLLGSVDSADLPGLYRQAYAAISPSYYEGFGLPPLEAMAMKCPVVVARAASYPEVCGEAALYVNPFDIADIARQICALIEDRTLRQTLIEKGADRACQFSWEKSAQAHIQLMDSL